MLNLLTKTKPWMVASLIVATSVFGQDSCNPCPKPCPPKCEKPCPAPCPKPCPAPVCKPKCCPTPCPQPCPPTQLCPPPCPDPCCPPWPVPVLNAAYNYPAGITTRCPWDIYFDAAFVYWQPIEEQLEPGLVRLGTLDRSEITMDFDYKPGFKVGFGWNADYDNWDLHAEYTWFHSKHHQSASITPVAGGAVRVVPRIAQPVAEIPVNAYNSVTESWRLKLDAIDLDIGRWRYEGTKLVVRPYVGARAAWIRQNLHIVYTNLGNLGTGTLDTETVDEKSTSWAIGPRAGIDSNWNLGAGFRLFGNGSADILFTRYNRIKLLIQHTNTTLVPFEIHQNRLNTLRTHLDMDLGIGWGTYWDCNNWYTDIALGYEFQVFWDQNMFRHIGNGAQDFTIPNGNLYIHGLTATFRLDF